MPPPLAVRAAWREPGTLVSERVFQRGPRGFGLRGGKERVRRTSRCPCDGARLMLDGALADRNDTRRGEAHTA